MKIHFFGRPVFGSILPFIGFKNFPVTDEDVPIISGREGKPSGWYTDIFVFEWLFIEITFFRSRIKRNY